VITSVRLANLRGVERGEVADLPPLAVLVGPNGAGKSTVLEALAVGAGNQPAAFVGQVVRQRHGWNGASYLCGRRGGEATLGVDFASGERRAIRLRYEAVPTGLSTWDIPPGHASGPLSAIHVHLERTGTPDEVAPVTTKVVFDLANGFQAGRVDGLGPEDRVRLLNPASARGNPLWRTLGEAVKAGRDEAVFDLLRDVLGEDFRDLYPIQESDDGKTNVHARYRWGTVPVDVAGDGIRALVRIALELAGRAESAILLEEPEIHQHPRTLVQTARALHAGVARQMQVVLTTHSLELVDALVDVADDEALGRMAVYRLALVDGALRSHRIPGDRVKVLRAAIAEDLR
jgi:energy-coupling factor transporter ATP-binding protein EcfA2